MPFPAITAVNLKQKMAFKKSTNDGNNPEKNMPDIPKDFEYELSNLNSVVGWSKSSNGLPQFSVENVEKYVNRHSNCGSVIKVYSFKKIFQSRRAIVRGTTC